MFATFPLAARITMVRDGAIRLDQWFACVLLILSNIDRSILISMKLNGVRAHATPMNSAGRSPIGMKSRNLNSSERGRKYEASVQKPVRGHAAAFLGPERPSFVEAAASEPHAAATPRVPGGVVSK